MRESNITDWRRETFGDLTAAFRFDDVATQPVKLPDTAGLLVRAGYEAASLPLPSLPGAEQQAPTQEAGTRKRVPRG